VGRAERSCASGVNVGTQPYEQVTVFLLDKSDAFAQPNEEWKQLSCASRDSPLVPFQELQSLLIKLLDILVDWRVSTAIKDQ